MSTESCPSFTALSEAFSAGPSAELRSHLEGCSACRAVLDDLARMKAAGKELPWRAPDPATEAERAAALVERAMVARRAHELGAARRRLVFVAASMAASLAAGYLLARQGTPAPVAESPTVALASPSAAPVAAEAPVREARAVVRGASGAQFHHAREKGGDEKVELSDGRLTLEVAPIQAGERFRIVTDDGEIEMTSGTIEVVADRGVLRSVVVLSGRAEVRPRSGAPKAVSAGERWGTEAVAPSAALASAPSPAAVASAAPSPAAVPAPVPALVPAAAVPSASVPAPSPAATGLAPASSSPAPSRTVVAVASPSPEPTPPPVTWVVSPTPSPSVSESPTPAIPAPTSVERSFKLGFDALRDGDFGVAAARFAEVEDKSDPLAEDASYWRAVALGRAGRTADARRAMEQNLERWPSSARAPEVSAMLGWILLRQGERDAARAWLEKAQARGNAAVKASAEKGLAELSR
jgi:TolA-binding protein